MKMNFYACYNDCPQLFETARSSYRRRGISLLVVDGHVYAGKEGCVARFTDQATAVNALTCAGYVPETDANGNTTFKP